MKLFSYFLSALCLSLSTNFTYADTLTGEVEKQAINIPAIVMFFIFVGGTLYITYLAARRTKSVKDFYTAGGGISGFKNGLAMAGDYMSAASFLGISAMVYTTGFDGLIYSTGWLVGWPIVLFLISERLRNLGKFTFADVTSYRLSQAPVRIFSATGTLAVVAFYLIAQMVGAGKLIELLFGLDYLIAILIVGFLMVLYVLFGGMLATTWVQIIKAVLLLSGATFMAIMVLKLSGFNFDVLLKNATEVERNGQVLGKAILAPGGLVSNPIDSLSLGMALMFGTAGLPHILMRFFTVPNAKEARKSVLYATGFIGYFYILTFIIGFGAIVLVTQDNPGFFHEVTTGGKTVWEMIGGNNMAALHLAEAVGGDYFLGFISAVAFATILAVVAGLTISGASAVSHDLYSSVIKKGQATQKQELRVSRITTVTLGVIAIVLGIVFEEQNVAYMVGLAFALASSANFPIIMMSMFWKGLTTRGAVIGGFIGLFSALILIFLGPTVWVSVLHHEKAIFPYGNPALFTIPLAFIAIWFFSVTDRSARAAVDKAAYEDQYVHSLTGINAAQASSH